MKILLIGTTDKLGGAAKISWEIKTVLEEKGHEVSMLVADKKSDDPKVKVIPRQKWRKLFGFLLATDDLLKTDWVLDTKEFKDADIIHCHNLHGRFFNLKTLQKMSLMKPVVWTLHDEWAITPHCACTFEGTKMTNGLYTCPNIKTPPRLLWKNTKYLSWRKNFLYNKSKLSLVVPSRWLKDRVESTILNKQNITLIPNGINTNVFFNIKKEEARIKLGLPADKKIILFLADNAANSPWKGWKYTEAIIDNLKDKENILFLNVGNHTPIQSKNNVEYVKQIIDPKQINLYYNATDVLLFTSVSENFPLVILEAMSCGLPIVSFDVGGVKEVLEHKINGFIAKYKDIDSLEEGINYIFSLDESQKFEMLQNSTKKIKEHYSLDKMIDAYMNLYEKIINKK